MTTPPNVRCVTCGGEVTGADLYPTDVGWCAWCDTWSAVTRQLDGDCITCGHGEAAHGTSRYCYECPEGDEVIALHEYKEAAVPTPAAPSPRTEASDG